MFGLKKLWQQSQQNLNQQQYIRTFNAVILADEAIGPETAPDSLYALDSARVLRTEVRLLKKHANVSLQEIEEKLRSLDYYKEKLSQSERDRVVTVFAHLRSDPDCRD